METITINDFNLGIILHKALVANGKRKDSASVTNFKVFTIEELLSIKKLVLKNSSLDDLSVLRYCANLEELTIESINAHIPSIQDSKHTYKGSIIKTSDFSFIKDLKKLRFLSLKNLDNLTSLDISGLNLARLELINNSNLNKITGLDDSRGFLQELILLKNNLNKNLGFDFVKLLENGLAFFDLDVNLYPILISKYPNLVEIVKKWVIEDSGSYKWSEQCRSLHFNSFSINQINEMHNKVMKVLSRIILPGYTPLEKSAAIFLYVSDHVEYDHLAVDTSGQENIVRDYSRVWGNGHQTFNTLYELKQSSYRAIMEGTSICEGYSNLMHYMLTCVGSASTVISCVNKSGIDFVTTQNANHAIIRVLINGDWYYYDPTQASISEKFDYFCKTKEEIQQIYSLICTEDEIKEAKNPEEKKRLATILIRVSNILDARRRKLTHEYINAEIGYKPTQKQLSNGRGR